MSRSAKWWLAAAWIGFALLPWHMRAGWIDWLSTLASDGPHSAAALILAGQAWWLAPITLPLLSATIPLLDTWRARDGRMLIAAGLAGARPVTAPRVARRPHAWGVRG